MLQRLLERLLERLFPRDDFLLLRLLLPPRFELRLPEDPRFDERLFDLEDCMVNSPSCGAGASADMDKGPGRAPPLCAASIYVAPRGRDAGETSLKTDQFLSHGPERSLLPSTG
ncbi:MAG: hypothetical protein JSS51_06665 [Planctomycetes bacterium]|nr:hypothetical protein [Planctomycetota bacterium]